MNEVLFKQIIEYKPIETIGRKEIPTNVNESLEKYGYSDWLIY